MNRALISALILGVVTSEEAYEWGGAFNTPDDSYKWYADKVEADGALGYADPKMKMAAIPITVAAGAKAVENTEPNGKHSLELECDEVVDGGVITPMVDHCYTLVFNEDAPTTTYTIDTTGISGVAFYTEHVPTEFEKDNHYLKDLQGVDIEPQAEVGGGGGHSHGGAEDAEAGAEAAVEDFDSKCVCNAATHNWKIECDNTQMIQDATDYLNNDLSCGQPEPGEECVKQYHVMQAHHDHCLHDDLPTGIEKRLHFYEGHYNDCFIKRQFDPDLEVCPSVTCSDQAGLRAAMDDLSDASNDCSTACTAAPCKAAIQKVLMAHDICPESDLPAGIETALHAYEEPCATKLCNSAPAAFDPYEEACSAEISAARGFGSQAAVFVTTSGLLFAVFMSS